MKAPLKLTDKMVEVIELRRQGMTFAEVAQATDRQIMGVKSVLGGVVRKLKRMGVLTTQQECHLYAHKLADPELQASASAKLVSQTELPPSHKRNLERRVHSLNFPDAEALDKIPPESLPKLLSSKAVMLLGYIDHFAAASAPLKDLTSSFEKLIHVKQLLEGQPTQIVGRERRQKVNELVKRVIEEAKRRGITMEGKFDVIEANALAEDKE